MILVDTSVWVDHLRSGNPALVELLNGGRVLGHPWVVGELALGNLAERAEILRLLGSLPQAEVATEPEVMALIDNHRLYGSGIGYVDAQLLASTLLTVGSTMWTVDRRLAEIALRLDCSFDPEG